MGTLLRLLLLKYLPRRLVPVFLVWDVWQLWRNRHARYYGRSYDRSGNPSGIKVVGPSRRKNTW